MTVSDVEWFRSRRGLDSSLHLEYVPNFYTFYGWDRGSGLPDFPFKVTPVRRSSGDFSVLVVVSLVLSKLFGREDGESLTRT